MRWSVAKSAVIVGAALILYYIKYDHSVNRKPTEEIIFCLDLQQQCLN